MDSRLVLQLVDYTISQQPGYPSKMNETQSDEVDPTDVLEQLGEALKRNGGTTAAEREHLVIMGVTAIIALLIPVVKKVNKLERYSLLLWIATHKWGAIVMGVGLTLLILTLHNHSEEIMRDIDNIRKFFIF